MIVFLKQLKEVEKVKAAITLGCDINCVGGPNKRTGLIYSAGQFFNEDMQQILYDRMQHKFHNPPTHPPANLFLQPQPSLSSCWILVVW